MLVLLASLRAEYNYDVLTAVEHWFLAYVVS